MFSQPPKTRRLAALPSRKHPAEGASGPGGREHPAPPNPRLGRPLKPSIETTMLGQPMSSKIGRDVLQEPKTPWRQETENAEARAISGTGQRPVLGRYPGRIPAQGSQANHGSKVLARDWRLCRNRARKAPRVRVAEVKAPPMNLPFAHRQRCGTLFGQETSAKAER